MARRPLGPALLAVVIGASLLTPSATPVVAAAAPGPAFERSPGEGPTGTTIVVSGDRCLLPGSTTPGDGVVVRLVTAGDVVAFATLPVEADGAWQGGLDVPAGTAARAYRLEARCVSPTEEDADPVTYAARSFTVTGEGPDAESVPATPPFSGGIEPFPRYDGRSTCSPWDKPGTVAFRRLVMANFGGGDYGISRACSIGGTSEHKEGRAWDWANDAGSRAARARVARLFDWLFATDVRCNRFANARRLGVMYVIWNRRTFRLYDTERGWTSYTGSSPHTDHVHFSLTRAGGNKRTSWWNPTFHAPPSWRPTDHDADPLNGQPEWDRPLTADFDGDGFDDVLWYQPGPGDELWWGGDDGRFDVQPVTMNGTYEPVVGDFNGDCNADVFWNGPGPADDYHWFGHRNRHFSGRDIVVDEDLGTPVVGDFNGDRAEDVLWYGEGTADDALWLGSIYGFSRGDITVSGTFQPVAGDFDGDRRDDIFWYGSGDARDVLWFGRRRGFAARAVDFGGVASPPLVGDFNGDQRSDIFWYGPGPDPDLVWIGTPSRSFVGRAVSMPGTYGQPAVGDFDGSGRDDILWHGDNTSPDQFWWY